MLSYRMLPAVEWSRLAPVFTAQGSQMPDPRTAWIEVAEKDDRIVGFVVMQCVWHMEPVWIDSDEREARHALSRLVHSAEHRLGDRPYYAFSEDEHVSGLCKAFGLEPLEYQIFVKEA